MNENEAQKAARSDERLEEEKGPTEKLRDQAKPESEQLTPGTEVPGAQDPDSVEIKNESNPNTE